MTPQEEQKYLTLVKGKLNTTQTPFKQSKGKGQYEYTFRFNSSSVEERDKLIENHIELLGSNNFINDKSNLSKVKYTKITGGISTKTKPEGNYPFLNINYFYDPKKLNKGTLYENKLTNKIKEIAAKVENSYNLDKIEKTKIDGKEIDIKIGNSKIEIKYSENAREGIKLGRVNFAGLGINDKYQNTSFYSLLPQNAKTEIDKFYARNKEKMNKSDRVVIKLSESDCMKLFQDHYNNSDYIQIYKMGIYSILGKNPTRINTIKPFKIKSGDLVIRIKSGGKKADDTYYLQMKAELTNCVVENTYGLNNKISLDNDDFLTEFVNNSIN